MTAITVGGEVDDTSPTEGSQPKSEEATHCEPHARNDLPSFISSRSCFETPLYRPITKTSNTSTSGWREKDAKLPVGHHLKASSAYSIDNLAALLSIRNLQLLLKEYRSLLIGRLDDS